MYNRSKRLLAHIEWLEDASHRQLYEERIARVHSLVCMPVGEFKDKSLTDIGLLSMLCGGRFMSIGAVLIGDDTAEGWMELLRSALYKYWGIRLILNCWERDARKNRQPRITLLAASQCLALAMGLGEDHVATWLGEQITQSRTNGCFGKWGLSHFDVFMYRLYCAYEDQPDTTAVEMRIADPDPYQDAIENMSDEEKMKLCISRICDWHVQRSVDNTDDYIAEFADDALDILPVEIWALNRVRQKLNLPVVTCDHPLLTPPFDQPPQNIPPVKDELLARIADLTLNAEVSDAV